MLKKVLLSFTALVCALMLVELFLRVFQPFGFRLRGEKIVLPTNTLISYQTQPTEKLDPIATVRKNSLGFRGQDPPSQFGSHLTLVAVGGSTTESIVISEGKTWPDALGQKLEKNFQKVWINNAGLDGHSTFGHLALLQDYLSSLKPKYTLFLIGANELALFEGREWDILHPKDAPITLLDSLAEKSELASLYQNFQRKRATAALGLTSHEIIQFGELTMATEKYPDYGALEEASPSANLANTVGSFQERQEYTAAFETRLKKLLHTARENGIEPILLTQPAVYGNAVDDVTGADLGKMTIFASNGEFGEGMTGAEKWQLLEEYNQITRKVAAEQQVLLIDLARNLPKSSRFFYDFIHFSNEGSQKVAELIYEELCPYLWENQERYRMKTCFD